MILQKDFKQLDTEVVGDTDERIEMGVDTESINHLMMILSSNLYQDSIGSIIREYTSNGVDANIEVDSKEAVIVKLSTDKIGNYFFEVTDFGPGLDDNDFRNIISKYGKSTKQLKKDQYGYFGLGCKSAFSYTNTFYYTCRKDGKERKYLMYKSDSGFTIDLMFENDTTEKNGVTVNIPVKGHDVYNFKNKIKAQLCYFDNVYFEVINEDFNKNFKIFREKDFHWSTLYNGNSMHLTLGRVNYPIDWDAIGLSRIDIPIGLKFDLDSGLFPIPNRENLIWNDETRKLVKDKLTKVATWFINKYNSQVKEMPSLLKAWPFINPPYKMVNIEGKDINITYLQKVVPSLAVEDVKIKGIQYLTPVAYKARLNTLLKDYRVVAVKRYNKMQSKSFYEGIGDILNKSSVLIADEVVISGYFREFLKESKYDIFVKFKTDIEKEDLEYFKQQLHLEKKDKKNWRNKIDEWKRVQKEFIEELIVDGTRLHLSKEYLDFKEQHRAKQKRNGKSKAGLNKQQGEVTIGFARPKAYGGYMFDKKVFKLSQLHSFKHLSVYLTDEEGELIQDYKGTYKTQAINFCKIGVQDLKKIISLKLHNFMSIKQLERTKTFSRVVTAMKAIQVVNKYEAVYKNRLTIVKQCVEKMADLHKELKDYILKNYHVLPSSSLESCMLATAEQNNLWDTTIIDKIKKLEIYIEDYNFIPLLVHPKDERTLEEDTVDEYQKLIHSLLLFKKLRYENKLTNLEICVRNEVPLNEEEYTLHETI